MSRVTVVLDGQAGSCGKGKLIGYLALHDNPSIAINNFMSNAGHTWVGDTGDAVITQHLPTSIVNPETRLVIGPGAAITPDILFNEMIKYHEYIGDRKVIIHPRAMVILPEHRETEKRVLKSGSTFKGCGAAQADKVMRRPGIMLFKEMWDRRGYMLPDDPEGAYIYNHIKVMDTMDYVNDAIDMGRTILVEGSQGTDLDINYGLPYPHTTSRQCHAGQLTADCGISPRLVDDIYMIIRPYPIRISNTTNLKDGEGKDVIISSGDYADSVEISWDEVRNRCGAPSDVPFGEMTTVTKKTRRVFEMNWDRLIYAAKLNRPTGIMINFMQYIDWSALGCTKWGDLSSKVKEFVTRVFRETGVPVLFIGTGAKNGEIIDLR